MNGEHIISSQTYDANAQRRSEASGAAGASKGEGSEGTAARERDDAENEGGAGAQGRRRLRDRGARHSAARARAGEDQSAGLRRVPQRRSHQGRRLAGPHLSARPGARNRRRDRRRWPRRHVVEKRPARRRRLARRAGFHVSCVPSRRFRQLRQLENLRDQLRRRLSGIHGRAVGGGRVDAGIARRRGSRAASVRRGYHLQFTAA